MNDLVNSSTYYNFPNENMCTETTQEAGGNLSPSSNEKPQISSGIADFDASAAYYLPDAELQCSPFIASYSTASTYQSSAPELAEEELACIMPSEANEIGPREKALPRPNSRPVSEPLLPPAPNLQLQPLDYGLKQRPPFAPLQLRQLEPSVEFDRFGFSPGQPGDLTLKLTPPEFPQPHSFMPLDNIEGPTPFTSASFVDLLQAVDTRFSDSPEIADTLRTMIIDDMIQQQDYEFTEEFADYARDSLSWLRNLDDETSRGIQIYGLKMQNMPFEQFSDFVMERLKDEPGMLAKLQSVFQNNGLMVPPIHTPNSIVM